MSDLHPKESVQVVIKENEMLLSGVLSFDTTPKVLNLLKNYLKQQALGEQSKTVFILNLNEITKSDSSGLALLMGLTREAKCNNFTLKINNIPKKLLDLARLSRITTVISLN